jgi:phosphatidylserine decarboxylase
MSNEIFYKYLSRLSKTQLKNCVISSGYMEPVSGNYTPPRFKKDDVSNWKRYLDLEGYVVIENVFEPEYLKTNCIQISIFMSPTNVHINRNPVSGIVSFFKYHPGKFLVAWHPKSSTENERTTIAIKTAKGEEILMRQIAGALARRIVWYCKENDVVKQTNEFGFIKFGSRVDLYLPLTSKINVQLNQIVKGGISEIAFLS